MSIKSHNINSNSYTKESKQHPGSAGRMGRDGVTRNGSEFTRAARLQLFYYGGFCGSSGVHLQSRPFQALHNPTPSPALHPPAPCRRTSRAGRAEPRTCSSRTGTLRRARSSRPRAARRRPSGSCVPHAGGVRRRLSLRSGACTTTNNKTTTYT